MSQTERPLNAAVLARRALRLTARLIERYGPRLTGTESCRGAADELYEEMKPACDAVERESFTMHPGSFLGFMKVSPTLFIAATFLMFFGYVASAAMVYTIAAIMAFSQFICYREVFDVFYPVREGVNIYGVIEPAGEVRCQVIVSGHHDSAYEFTLMTRLPGIYRFCVAGMILALTLAPVFAWASLVSLTMRGGGSGIASALTVGAFVSLVFIVPMYIFTGRNGTPGAGDNLIASAITVELAKYYGGAKKAGNHMLRHTRLIFASFDAEEAGLRGSRAFVKRHRAKLHAVPTSVLNLDSIYRADRIKFLVSDINGFVRLSRAMAKECMAAAAAAGYESRPFCVYPGVGGTDAAEFAKIGIEATTLIALPTDVEKERTVYHTREDTVENIEPGAVEACIRIIDGYIIKKEAGARVA